MTTLSTIRTIERLRTEVETAQQRRSLQLASDRVRELVAEAGDRLLEADRQARDEEARRYAKDTP